MRSLATILLLLLIVFIAMPMVAGPLWTAVRLPTWIGETVLHSLWMAPRSILGGLRGIGIGGTAGIVLLALAALAVIALLRRGNGSREAGKLENVRKPEMANTLAMQETYRRLERMHRRVEALETELLERQGRTKPARSRSARENIPMGV